MFQAVQDALIQMASITENNSLESSNTMCEDDDPAIVADNSVTVGTGDNQLVAPSYYESDLVSS